MVRLRFASIAEEVAFVVVVCGTIRADEEEAVDIGSRSCVFPG